MECKNGKTKEARRGLEICDSPNEPSELGEAKSPGLGNGINQIGSFNQNCSGGNYAGAAIKPNGSPGKILERLELIEYAYSRCLDRRQQHLEASLIETKEEREVFNNAVQDLKREIRELVSTEEQISEPE